MIRGVLIVHEFNFRVLGLAKPKSYEVVYPYSSDYNYSMRFELAEPEDFENYTNWTQVVRENPDKYCKRLNITAGELVEKLSSDIIDFERVKNIAVEYYDNNMDIHVEEIEVADKFSAWEKFNYLYVKNGGDPSVVKKFILNRMCLASQYGVIEKEKSLLEKIIGVAQNMRDNMCNKIEKVQNMRDEEILREVERILNHDFLSKAGSVEGSLIMDEAKKRGLL